MPMFIFSISLRSTLAPALSLAASLKNRRVFNDGYWMRSVRDSSRWYKQEGVNIMVRDLLFQRQNEAGKRKPEGNQVCKND